MGPTVRRAIAVLLVLVLLPAATPIETLQASETIETTALAVAEGPSGFVGLSSQVQVRVIADGDGQVFVDTKPLSETDMQASARLAARVAADTLGLDWTEYDYLIVVRSSSTIIGGPSAGGVMALAITVALHNLASPEQPWTLDDRVAATGTINPDGTIGPVGGIPAKAGGAKDAGITTFLYPAGQEVASTRTVFNGTVRDVLIDMDRHCDDLRITCRSVATLRDLIEVAAGVSIVLPDVPDQDTSVYEQYLGPSVRQQVDDMAALVGGLAAGPWTPAQVEAFEARRAQAQDWSTRAGEALDQDLFYQAATFSFRGNIQAVAAHILADVYGSDSLDALEQALQACDEEADEAVAHVDGRAPTDVTGWLAVGAAQVRAAEAQALADQAAFRVDRIVTVEDLGVAAEAVAFCLERAGSVHWWASLADALPAGAAVGDPRSLVLDLIDRAREATAYAQAVGALSPEAGLEAAQELLDAGWLPGATLRAVEAEVGAALALQSVAGQIVNDTLDAARETATRAVVQARAAGSEPVVSVSLLELAATTDGPDALRAYWEARTLALLGPVEPAEPSFRTLPRSPDADQAAMAFAFVTGLIAATGIWLMVYISLQLTAGISRKR